MYNDIVLVVIFLNYELTPAPLYTTQCYLRKGPGTFVMIRKPRGITQFMGEDEMPILPVNTPFIPVNSNLMRPRTLRVRDDSGRQNITRIVKVEACLQWVPF